MRDRRKITYFLSKAKAVLCVAKHLFHDIKPYAILLFFFFSTNNILKSLINFDNWVVLLLFVIGSASLTKVDAIV
jgi:hypothetical protein